MLGELPAGDVLLPELLPVLLMDDRVASRVARPDVDTMTEHTQKIITTR